MTKTCPLPLEVLADGNKISFGLFHKAIQSSLIANKKTVNIGDTVLEQSFGEPSFDKYVIKSKGEKGVVAFSKLYEGSMTSGPYEDLIVLKKDGSLRLGYKVLEKIRKLRSK